MKRAQSPKKKSAPEPKPSALAGYLAAFEQARKDNNISLALEVLLAALKTHTQTGEPLPQGFYYDLAVTLYRLGRYDEAETHAREGIRRNPKNADLYNLLGVLLKSTGRLEEAAAAYQTAIRINPENVSPWSNLGNVYLSQHNGPKAIEVLNRVSRMQPQNPELVRLMGIAHRYAGDFPKALEHFKKGRELNPENPGAWIDEANILDEMGEKELALNLVGIAIQRLGSQRMLIDARVKLMRRAGRYDDVEAWLKELISINQPTWWLHFMLADTIVHFDQRAANENYDIALKLAPNEPNLMMRYAFNLDRTRGPDEAENIAHAYDLAMQRLKLGGDMRRDAKDLRNILIRCANYEELDRLGSFEDLGNYFARSGQEAALHYMMGQVSLPSHRRDLITFHRTWGKSVEELANLNPLPAAPAITGRAKIRIGFMSSDLRWHPVAYFAAPLMLAYDRSKFEVFCYSWSTAEADGVEQKIAESVDAFRKHTKISDRDAAKLIQADAPDILFELGGSTAMNKLNVMAWKPAKRQASWLGYPHSAGLGTIDRILVDPFLKPEDPALLIEKPFLLDRSWVALDQPTFHPMPPIIPTTPQERNGYVTFGTMNNPYKFNPRVIAAWAAVMRGVPNSRFLFVRPEGDVPAFVENMARHFEANGVGRDRINHIAIRGAHLQHYNKIDIGLDTFPQTGGTTTCETLWMGVPVITLVGEAFFERISYSNLNNLGLADHCAFDVDSYIAKAIALAGQTQWRTEFRRTIQQRLRSHPLGRPDLFVQDFYQAAAKWMQEGRP